VLGTVETVNVRVRARVLESQGMARTAFGFCSILQYHCHVYTCTMVLEYHGTEFEVIISYSSKAFRSASIAVTGRLTTV
jgi:hypothetical protein